MSLFFILFVFVSLSDAGQKNFMWKVESKTATVYLLGSVHYMKKDAYPLNTAIEDAFSRSNVLVVEADVNNPEKLYFSKFIDSAFYPGQDMLSNHVSRSTYELVTGKFGKYGLPAEILLKEKPWFVALTFTALELLKAGFEPGYGIDMHFLSKADKKKIVELESLDQQIDLMSNFSDQEQEAFLVHTIKELDTLGRESDRLVQAWKAGDEKGLESIIGKESDDDRGMASIYKKLLYARNLSMASKVEDFLHSKDTFFVVVGAGHLVGKRGIIELLRAKGYEAKQM